MFGELSQTNLVLLQNARHLNPGYFCEFMSCLVFAAFKHEAFINHIGPRLFDDWNERQSLDAKQTRVLTHLRITVDKGKRPFQTLGELFKARNQLAHGQPANLTHIHKIERGTREQIRQTKPLALWEKACTLEFAERAYEDTEKIAELVWEAGGFDLYELRRRGHSYSIEEIRDHEGDLSGYGEAE